jgi:hypothetical protein
VAKSFGTSYLDRSMKTQFHPLGCRRETQVRVKETGSRHENAAKPGADGGFPDGVQGRRHTQSIV